MQPRKLKKGMFSSLNISSTRGMISNNITKFKMNENGKIQIWVKRLVAQKSRILLKIDLMNIFHNRNTNPIIIIKIK